MAGKAYSKQHGGEGNFGRRGDENLRKKKNTTSERRCKAEDVLERNRLPGQAEQIMRLTRQGIGGGRKDQDNNNGGEERKLKE